MLDYLDYKYRKKLKSIDIKKELKIIDNKGYVPTIRAGNTGIGHTIQDQLGISENNDKFPDFLYKFKPIELKSKRRLSTSRISFFTDTPIWEPLNALNILNNFGYMSNNRLSLYCSMSVGRICKQGFVMDLNLTENKLFIIKNNYGKICYFNYSDLLKIMKKKINYLLLVIADNQIINSVEHFNYNEAWLYSNFKKKAFTDLLLNRKIIFDFRMHAQPSGLSARDHNLALRTHQKYLEILYEKKEKYYP